MGLPTLSSKPPMSHWPLRWMFKGPGVAVLFVLEVVPLGQRDNWIPPSLVGRRAMEESQLGRVPLVFLERPVSAKNALGWKWQLMPKDQMSAHRADGSCVLTLMGSEMWFSEESVSGKGRQLFRSMIVATLRGSFLCFVHVLFLHMAKRPNGRLAQVFNPPSV